MQLLPLSSLIEQVRIEARLSTNPSRGLDATEYLTQVVNRNYQLLWDDFDWEHNKVSHTEAVVELQAGQNIYDFPSMVDSSTVSKAWATVGNVWIPLTYGISPDDYSAVNPEKDERADPAQKWEVRSPTKFEVHPMPASNVERIGFDCAKRKFTPLVKQEDVAQIDALCIILICASELLANQSAKDAQVKLRLAENRINKMKARSSSGKQISFRQCDETAHEQRQIRVAYVRN